LLLLLPLLLLSLSWLLLMLLLPHLSCWQELLKCAGTAREDPPCERSHLPQSHMHATNRSELKATAAALFGKQYRAVSCCFKLAVLVSIHQLALQRRTAHLSGSN
jgi:hypothetical protein